MPLPTLYVRSIMTRTGKEQYTRDDQQAKTFLEYILRSSFSIVDLTQCDFYTKMCVILAGLYTTPTLVMDREKYKGLGNIKKLFNETLPRQILNKNVDKRIKIGFEKKVEFGYSATAGEGIVVYPPSEDSDWFYVGKDKKNYWVVYLRDVGWIENEKGNVLWKRVKN